MTLGEKIYALRKERGITQEELADRLGVSRQAVSKWELGQGYPETEKLREICKLFSISADELLFGEETEKPQEEQEQFFEQEPPKEEPVKTVFQHPFRFEYKSKTMVGSLPLVHVCFGLCHCRAKGVIAIGNVATGLLSIGFLSVGLLSWGLLSLGLIALGVLSIGLAAFGSIAVGLFVAGGVAIGVWAFGGVAIGRLAVGGAAIGHYAVGDWASGFAAFGLSHAEGEHIFVLPEELAAAEEYIKLYVSGPISSFLDHLIHTLS